ncbi:uncharacterized protein J4E84_009341 [Alternaria hordeiaustralica]|uniref:uncharacterized protein n=1 Tax=Alternaria hordeiaustralica TaxID=1187925 RepID=UPI0020C4264B|nr:uncharacterized protein J4E84_009341 [Alternaria hordeiaustralica]KAI4676747.1 hypothetical protein J4E84_009341 [Alternaria hordeiaustralica]
MARLRVPASPVKTRRANYAYEGAGNKTPSQPNHSGPQPEINVAFDSSANDPPEHPTSFPRIVRSFALMDVKTKRDVQGYIVGQYKAIKQMGHEHITATGTKTVFFLGQAQQEEEFDILDEDMKTDLGEYINEDEDADRSWRGVCDFMQKIPTSKAVAPTEFKDKNILDTETPHQARLMRAQSAPSLARCIANASFDSAGSETDSDSEDDDIDLELKIENALSSFAKKVEELEDVTGALSITPPGRTYSDAHPFTPSPPKDIDIPYPCGPKQNSRLRRHSGNRSLASMIAHVEDHRTPSRSSPSASLSSCPLPAGTTYSVIRKPCYDPSFEGHSPCATHDEGSCGLSADDALDMLQERFGIVHCATAGTGFDCREWLEYKLETGGLQTWEGESWPNAPERIGNEFEDAQNSITRNESEDCDVEELSQLRASLTETTDNDEPMWPEVIANRPYTAPLMYEEAADFIEHVATNPDVDSECWSEPLDGCAKPRRKWTSKMKHCLKKIPQNTKQATHDYVKATKRFSRTAWRVLPAALSSRHPFQKIDSIL